MNWVCLTHGHIADSSGSLGVEPTCSPNVLQGPERYTESRSRLLSMGMEFISRMIWTIGMFVVVR